MKSIIQEDKEHCFLCGMNANLEPLAEHHVFYGAGRRKLSEKYGLKVYLHNNKCHIYGEKSVHKNAKVDRALKAVVQRRAMQYYGWKINDFIEIFGKNYL